MASSAADEYRFLVSLVVDSLASVVALPGIGCMPGREMPGLDLSVSRYPAVAQRERPGSVSLATTGRFVQDRRRHDRCQEARSRPDSGMQRAPRPRPENARSASERAKDNGLVRFSRVGGEGGCRPQQRSLPALARPPECGTGFGLEVEPRSSGERHRTSRVRHPDGPDPRSGSARAYGPPHRAREVRWPPWTGLRPRARRPELRLRPGPGCARGARNHAVGRNSNRGDDPR